MVTQDEVEMSKRLLEIVKQLEQERRKLPSVGKCACRREELCAWHVAVDNDLLDAIKRIKYAAAHLTQESG